MTIMMMIFLSSMITFCRDDNMSNLINTINVRSLSVRHFFVNCILCNYDLTLDVSSS
jgi:hypothetical protein